MQQHYLAFLTSDTESCAPHLPSCQLSLGLIQCSSERTFEDLWPNHSPRSPGVCLVPHLSIFRISVRANFKADSPGNLPISQQPDNVLDE